MSSVAQTSFDHMANLLATIPKFAAVGLSLDQNSIFASIWTWHNPPAGYCRTVLEASLLNSELCWDSLNSNLFSHVKLGLQHYHEIEKQLGCLTDQNSMPPFNRPWHNPPAGYRRIFSEASLEAELWALLMSIPRKCRLSIQLNLA